MVTEFPTFDTEPPALWLELVLAFDWLCCCCCFCVCDNVLETVLLLVSVFLLVFVAVVLPPVAVDVAPEVDPEVAVLVLDGGAVVAVGNTSQMNVSPESTTT